jgi:hypothetical protein
MIKKYILLTPYPNVKTIVLNVLGVLNSYQKKKVLSNLGDVESVLLQMTVVIFK